VAGAAHLLPALEHRASLLRAVVQGLEADLRSLGSKVRELDGRHLDPSTEVIDARSVPGVDGHPPQQGKTTPQEGLGSQVYAALVRHFTDYAAAFIARCTDPGLPETNHDVIAQFVAHGFAGAIKAWLSDKSMTKGGLVDAAVACAPVWWT
jgi:hypothetical protein